MSRLTMIILVVGTIGLTSAATYWFVAPTSNTGAEASREDQRRLQEKFFRAPDKNPLVGQEMRPRW